MDRIKLHDKYFVPYIPNEKIMKAIDAVAAKINDDFKGCEDIPLIVCVLNGSIMVFDTVITRNVKLSEAPSHGKPVITYDANSAGANNYLNLAREIIKRNAK